jgi:hypothetical protein
VTRTSTFRSTAVGIATLVASLFLPAVAKAEVTLTEKDGWTVYINGRIQAFLNYNYGTGFPQNVRDANGNQVTTLQGGGIHTDEAQPWRGKGPTADNDPGQVQELRIKSGFVGNVLGFGIKKQITKDTEVLGYTSVTTYIDSTNRRKYLEVRPDWRQGFMKISGPWGAVTAGRDLVLFNRGATEISFLYGFKYGMGWVGSVSNLSGTGPTAGHCGFGVLCNGFGAGISYTTPSLAGAQLQIGIYDAQMLPGSALWERTMWPRGEAEAWYETKLGTMGMLKLFANGAYQKLYKLGTTGNVTIAGAGYGARVEVGPVKLGLAGHYGTGIGMDFALQPTEAVYHPTHPDRILRTFDGYYGQLMVSPLKTFDIMAGVGMTRVKLLEEDKTDQADDDMTAATPASNDDGNPKQNDPVSHIPIKHQIGISGGIAHHLTDYLHLQLEYFRAMFEWYAPSPSLPGVSGPQQSFHVVNAGITYDF